MAWARTRSEMSITPISSLPSATDSGAKQAVNSASKVSPFNRRNVHSAA
jgi:hypothetical protein